MRRREMAGCGHPLPFAAAAGLAEVFGDEVEDVGQSSEDDHVSKVGDGNTEHGGEDLLGDQLAQHEEACADEDGSSDIT